MGSISLLNGQIVIPAYLSLPLPVVIIGGLLSCVGAIALVLLYISVDPLG